MLLLVPGVGLLSFPKDKAPRASPREFYVNAINVMRGADGVDDYAPIAEQEAFDIEYWLLEEAKLQRLPKPKSLDGPGRPRHRRRRRHRPGATARRLLAEGARVVLADIDAAALDAAWRDARARPTARTACAASAAT